MSDSGLAYWHSHLNKQGFSCELVPEDEQIRYPRLNIALGPDQMGRERTLELRIDTYLLPPDLQAGETDTDTNSEKVLHLFVALPFFIKPEAMGEVARLLLLLNKPLDIPGFGIDETARLAFFRYGLFTNKGHHAVRLMVALIGVIHLLVDSLTAQIEAVANGASIKETLDHLVHSLTDSN